MPIQFRCPACHKTLSIARRKAGTSIACPLCQADLTVPDDNRPTSNPAPATSSWWLSAAPKPAPVLQALPDVIVDAPLPAPPPAVQQPEPVRAPVPPPLIAAGVLGLILTAGVLAYVALPNHETGPEPQGDGQNQVANRDAGANTPRPGGKGDDEEESPSPVDDEDGAGDIKPRKQVVALPTPNKVKPQQPTNSPPIKHEVKKPIEKPATPAKLTVKRRQQLAEDDLVKQIARAPELAFDNHLHPNASLAAIRAAVANKGKSTETTSRFLVARTDLAGLPLRLGDACKISANAAEHLQGGSLALREQMSGTVRTRVAGDTRPDPDKLHTALNKDSKTHNKWLKAEAIPALQQLLMAEQESIREVLVDQLSRIEGKEATRALAQRAIFDLHPRVREKAIKALSTRPLEDARPVLLGGFTYPWPVVAEHAAEALATLKMKDTVPELVALLDKPDPSMPYEKPRHKGLYVKELVKINHLRNCIMCHAVSLNQDDKVRGFVPRTDQPLPPPFTRQYYAARRQGTFVRADITYLKQDFSVPLEVKKPGKWPTVQRFDFMVRERLATAREITAAKKPDAKKPTEHQKALFFVLRELTGKDPGPTVDDWKGLLLQRKLTAKTIITGLKAVRGIAFSEGVLYLADSGKILRRQSDGSPKSVLKDDAITNSLAVDSSGTLWAAQSKPGLLVKVDLAKRDTQVMASKYSDRRFNGLRRLTFDPRGGVYFIDGPAADSRRDTRAVYYRSAQGSLTKVLTTVEKARGLAVSFDGKLLFVVTGGAEVQVFDLESAGSPYKGRAFGTLPGAKGSPAAVDVAVDSRGNVCVLDAGQKCVVMFNSAGARLARVALGDVPVACCVNKDILYVATRKAVHAVDLSDGAKKVAREP